MGVATFTGFRPITVGPDLIDIPTATFVELLRAWANGLGDPTPSGLALTSDADDELLVDLARAASTDVLVSDDGQVLALRGALMMMSPSEFLAHGTGGDRPCEPATDARRAPSEPRSNDEVGSVGARGVEPPGPITRIIVPDYIAVALRDVA